MLSSPKTGPIGGGESCLNSSTIRTRLHPSSRIRSWLPKPPRDELAGRSTRLAAAIVDGVLLMAILIPVQMATGYMTRVGLHEVGLLEEMVMSLLGILVALFLNGYLLYTRGQTIGKALTRIQIVDYETGRLLPFLRVYVYRYLWMLPLTLAVPFIPDGHGWILLEVVCLDRCVTDLRKTPSLLA